MKDSFFITSDNESVSQPQKRKGTNANALKSVKRRKQDKDHESEDEIGAGGIDDIDFQSYSTGEEESDEEDKETAAEKRLRLAKEYLKTIETELEENVGFDAKDIDRDLIAERLRDDALETSGKLFRNVADQYASYLSHAEVKMFPRGHQLSITSAVITPDQKYVYSGSKDGSIIKWDFITAKKLHVFRGGRRNTGKAKVGHTGRVLSLAISFDGTYLASGGDDNRLNIWSVKDDTHVHCFNQHRDAVTSLTFRKGSNQLYSASNDRTVKVWNIDEMTYVETLFGHQDQITGIDTLSRETCITSGGRDRTLRLWKIIEESQLVYRGSQGTSSNINDSSQLAVAGSIDCLTLINEEYFLSGSDCGSISLWNIGKKKPVFIQRLCHGTQTPRPDEVEVGNRKKPFWVTAIACVKYTDLFLSGSWDGEVKVWRISPNFKNFTFVGNVAVPGFINSLSVLPPKSFPTSISHSHAPTRNQLPPPSANKNSRIHDIHILVGTGQEHKSGRWLKLGGKHGRYANSIYNNSSDSREDNEEVVVNGVNEVSSHDNGNSNATYSSQPPKNVLYTISLSPSILEDSIKNPKEKPSYDGR
ncbi:WD40-repeat-containing domain protein [Paraphysoderma sedebokerense]|nr:WD40-repeat-containing domain protein [Paraphysoderma sedebokerense]KAI9140887.1 WD40-repeat-containing domain protein [Paraphysoderma sedebokerense]